MVESLEKKHARTKKIDNCKIYFGIKRRNYKHGGRYNFRGKGRRTGEQSLPRRIVAARRWGKERGEGGPARGSGVACAERDNLNFRDF